MLDIKSCNLAAKGTWVRRLLSPESSKWKELTWFMLNIDRHNLVNSNCILPNRQAKTNFHTHIIKAWTDINSFIPISLKEIINQSICENNYIRIENKPIKDDFLGINNKTKLKEMKIKDIIENQCKIISKFSLEEKLGNRISILRYMSIIKAIPTNWKDKIKKIDNNLVLDSLIIGDEPHIKIKHKFKTLEKINSKDLYSNLIGNIPFSRKYRLERNFRTSLQNHY